jgi:hypothetical protein
MNNQRRRVIRGAANVAAGVIFALCGGAGTSIAGTSIGARNHAVQNSIPASIIATSPPLAVSRELSDYTFILKIPDIFPAEYESIFDVAAEEDATLSITSDLTNDRDRERWYKQFNDVDFKVPLLVWDLPGARLSKQLIAQTSSGGGYIFPSAWAPFIGNQTVISGFEPSPDGSQINNVGMSRQSDCSTTSYVLQSGTSNVVATLPNAQDSLHQLARLTTTPDVFATGCGDPEFGLQDSITYLPVISTGSVAMVADLNPSTGDLEVQETNVTTGVKSTVTLAPGSDGPGPFYVADLNGDNQFDVIDLLTDPTTLHRAVTVFMSNGDGTFKAPVYLDLVNGYSPAGMTVDDVNGDDMPDLIAVDPGAGPGNGVVTVFPGKGDGTFNSAVTSSIGQTYAQTAISSVITADFNGDGKKDLLVGGDVLFGNGDGTFSTGQMLPASVQSLLYANSFVASADLNRDGKADLLISSVTGAITVQLGNGDGTFQQGNTYAPIPKFLPTSEPFLITDIDGDGNPDIIVGQASVGFYSRSLGLLAPEVQVLMGRGDGTFVGAPVVTGNFALQTSGFISGTSQEMATGDFNGDGKADALVRGSDVSGNPLLQVLPGNGAGNLGSPINSAVGYAPYALMAADINGDDKPDAVIAGKEGSVYVVSVALNNGDGSFAAAQDLATLPGAPLSLATGDFNGDGQVDIAVGIAGTGVEVLLGQAGATFAAPTLVNASSYPLSLATGDLAGSGRFALVIADGGSTWSGASNNAPGGMHVYLGNADGSFTASTLPTTAAAYFSNVALADFNGDGKLDLMAAGVEEPSNTVTPMLYGFSGNGDGTFQAPQSVALTSIDGLGTTTMTIGDFNHDGIPDIAVGNPHDLTEIVLSLGGGNFGLTGMVAGQQPAALAAVDLKGTGFADLLVGGPAIGTEIYDNIGTTQAWTPLSVASNNGNNGSTTTTASSGGGGGIPDPLILIMTAGYLCRRELKRRLHAAG